MRLWPTHCHATRNTSTKACRYFTKEEKKKIMKQLGVIVSQLSYLRFDKIGSLVEEKGCYTVNACLFSGHLLHHRNIIRGVYRGPFHLEQDYYESLFTIFRLHIQHFSMEHHVFFASVPLPQEYRNYASYLSATDRWNDFITIGFKVDSGKNRLHYFIASQFLERMIPYLSDHGAQKNDFEKRFSIRHSDLSINNIFVDDDCNITCIIDWAFASSVPISEFFITSGLSHSKDRLDSELVDAFKNGFTNHLIKEKRVIHHSFWEIADKL